MYARHGSVGKLVPHFASKRQLIALALILVGLGLLLFGVPQLSEARDTVPSASRTPTVSFDLRCLNCHSVTQQIPSAALDQLQLPDPCDICHTTVINTDNPHVARANHLEKEWRQLSARTIQLHKQASSSSNTIRNDTHHITRLLAEAHRALQSDDLTTAQRLLKEAKQRAEQTEKDLAQRYLFRFNFDAFCILGNDTGQKSYRFLSIIDRRVDKDVRSASTFRKLTLVDHLSLWLTPADVMHRRAPPVDEDAPVSSCFILHL